MNAQKKNNGWFFNKNIIDEINSVPEDVMMNAPTPTTSEVEKTSEDHTELKQMLHEKEEAFEQYKKQATEEKQRLLRENENFKQTILQNGEDKIQNRRQIQNLEAEIRQNRKEIQYLQERQDSSSIKKQLAKAEEKIEALTASLGDYQAIQQELKESEKKYNELEMKQKVEASQQEVSNQQFERQLKELNETLHEKDEKIVDVERMIAEKEQALEEKESLIQQLIEEQRDSSIEGEVVSELQHQIMVIQKENEQLKQEAQYSQHEIGEVLVAARKQANRMVEKAKLDAQRIIQHSEEEIQTIQDRAKEISFEVDESRQAIMVIYDELKSRVDQLAQNEVISTEGVEKPFDYFDYSHTSKFSPKES